MNDMQQILTDFVRDIGIARKPLTLTVTEAAYHLRCGEGTIRNLIKAGKLTPVPDMGQVLIPTEQLERLVRGES